LSPRFPIQHLSYPIKKLQGNKFDVNFLALNYNLRKELAKTKSELSSLNFIISNLSLRKKLPTY